MKSTTSTVPLAERMRPSTLDDFVGQEHLVGEGKILRTVIRSGIIPSMIFWGPPGVGKTTLARIIAKETKKTFVTLSAISSGVKEVREVIDLGKKQGNLLLFIDEIHRFNKAQQDSLLGAVEKGWVTLIGATTENPSFEVISALLSRCQVYILKELSRDDLLKLLARALKADEILMKREIEVLETEALLRLSGGDARKMMNLLEITVNATPEGKVVITDDAVIKNAQKKMALYDKSGEQHYDIISAFIKSIRGSDPNAAVYWLARMIEGGEDPLFIARRMLILASEDIGNANPNALVIANSCFQAVNVIGYPECSLILSQTAIYLATSPKSNSSTMAIGKATELVKMTGDLPVPLHIRNAPTGLMRQLGYGKGYKYAHEFEGNFTQEEFLPEKIRNTILYQPGDNPKEKEILKKLQEWWIGKYGYE
ncbi:MAG TPA: replication-associated recombination protein A [Chitinophagales bacterium]|nr:replication-associated recombination protein A [Chitinophagales bacterium]